MQAQSSEHISKAEILVFQKDDIYRILTYTKDTLKRFSMVVMQISETTDLEALNGRKAIEALCDYVEELEKQRGKHLTGKQTDAMIRLASELISSIGSGMRDSIEGGDLILHGRIMRAQLRANAVSLRQQSLARI